MQATLAKHEQNFEMDFRTAHFLRNSFFSGNEKKLALSRCTGTDTVSLRGLNGLIFEIERLCPKRQQRN